jgi:hypothetical protein
MRGRTLSDSCFSHIVHAPIDRVDLAAWVFGLTSVEYRRCCSPAHIAAGISSSADGRAMPITVEMIGECVLVAQYVGEITDPRHCRMVATSELFSSLGRTTSHVVWDLSVEPLDEETCEYVNRIVVTATDDFIGFIREHGIPFERAAAIRDRVAAAHNEQETSGFAESIERKALSAFRARSGLPQQPGP